MFQRKKSKRARAGDLIAKYLKLKATTKVAKGAGKAAKWTAAGKLAKSTAQRAPKKGWLVVAGGLGTAALAARKWRGTSPDAAA
ncbi:MAG: hypothetical protein ACRDKY_12245 [Solirubrobacteraceae bacterium]